MSKFKPGDRVQLNRIGGRHVRDDRVRRVGTVRNLEDGWGELYTSVIMDDGYQLYLYMTSDLDLITDEESEPYGHARVLVREIMAHIEHVVEIYSEHDRQAMGAIVTGIGPKLDKLVEMGKRDD